MECEHDIYDEVDRLMTVEVDRLMTVGVGQLLTDGVRGRGQNVGRVFNFFVNGHIWFISCTLK